ncbi:MAG: shikimate kinase [Verrucomicrobiota bacterium]|nr:shikimate kinase [Verrucomicrobiota bacterium]
MSFILFGFKGSGKTYWGRKLAQKWKKVFLDTDELLLEKTGHQTIRELYQAVGEKEFRSLEKQVIGELASVQQAVIAVGGGAVLDPENVALLQKIGQLIYLDVSLETVQKRGVTLVQGPIEEIYRERKPIYESIPARRVKVEDFDGL